MRNLHRIMGARFTRFKPNLCPHCTFFREHREWYGVCQAKGHLLSDPRTDKGRCREYETVKEVVLKPTFEIGQAVRVKTGYADYWATVEETSDLALYHDGTVLFIRNYPGDPTLMVVRKPDDPYGGSYGLMPSEWLEAVES